MTAAICTCAQLWGRQGKVASTALRIPWVPAAGVSTATRHHATTAARRWRSELRLYPVDLVLLDHECPGEDLVADRRLGPEHGVGDGDHAGELAAERGECEGGGLAVVELEVDEPLREDEHVADHQLLGEEHVVVLVGADEAHEERALDHHQDLGAARVRMRRVLPAGEEVDARHGYAQRVQPRQLRHRHRRHRGALRVRLHGRDVEE
jgi:hypothetical protein